MKKFICGFCVFVTLFALCSCNKTDKMPFELQSETEHFEIYCSDTDKAYYERLANDMEEYCRKTEADLSIDKPQKIKIAVYPDRPAFSDATGVEDDGASSILSEKGVINTYSPSSGASELSAWNYHVSGILPYAIIKNAFDAPEYLLYGAALIEGGTPFRAEEALKLIDEGIFPDITKLKKLKADDFEKAFNSNAPLIAYMVSDYILTEFGADTYIKLLNKPNTKSILALNDEELRENVIEYIKKTYSEIPFDLQKETEHFKFYCEADDVSWIDDVVTALEDNCDRITSDLLATITEKCDVVLFPDYNWFVKKGRGKYMNVPDNCYGFWHDGILYLPSPSIPTIAGNHIPNTAVHEFVHHVTQAVSPDTENENTINRKIPRYIVEGIAVYEEKGHADSYDFMITAKSIRNGTFPTFEEIEGMYRSGTDPNVYSWGNLFCEYVIKKYGNSKMVEILKNPDIEAELGKSKDDIRLEWIEFLKKEYKINV